MKTIIFLALVTLNVNAATNNGNTNSGSTSRSTNNRSATNGAVNNNNANNDMNGNGRVSDVDDLPATLQREKAMPNSQNNLSDRQSIMDAQQALVSQGFPLVIDGAVGPNTTQAIRQYQSRNGLPSTGTLDPDTMRSLKQNSEE